MNSLFSIALFDYWRVPGYLDDTYLIIDGVHVRTGLSPMPCGSCTLHQESADAKLRTGAATPQRPGRWHKIWQSITHGENHGLL